jgi:hypothetical protein
MAKHRSHKRKSYSRGRTRRMAQSGGNLGSNPPSAWGWGLGTAGNGWTQFMNSLTLQPGQNAAAQQSNDLVPKNNLNAQTGPILQAGGRRRRHRSRGRRGGNWAAVASQAAVPAALVLMNQSLGRRRHSRRHRR